MFQDQAEHVLGALPALRRWLVRSVPPRNQPQGHTPAPLSHIRVLIHLFQRGPMTMGELAHGLGISCSTATECVTSLEARGRVLRQRSATDRRQVVVRLTPEAEVAASQVLSQRKVVVEGMLQQLSSSERRAFVKGLSLLANGAESWMDRMPSYGQGQPVEEGVRAK